MGMHFLPSPDRPPGWVGPRAAELAHQVGAGRGQGCRRPGGLRTCQSFPFPSSLKPQSRTFSMRVYQCLQNFLPIPSSAFSGHDDFNPLPASNTPLSLRLGRPCWIAHHRLIVATPCACSAECCPLPMRGRSGSRGSGAWTPRRTPPGRRSSQRTSP